MSIEDLRTWGKTLIDVAEQVETIKSVQTVEKFEELQAQLNQIQDGKITASAENDARAAWFIHGLVSFERHFVGPIEQGADGWEKWNQHATGHDNSPPKLLMHFDTIIYFLRRRYLGRNFSRSYKCVTVLFKRIISATNHEPVTNHIWKERLTALENNLIEGLL